MRSHSSPVDLKQCRTVADDLNRRRQLSPTRNGCAGAEHDEAIRQQFGNATSARDDSGT